MSDNHGMIVCEDALVRERPIRTRAERKLGYLRVCEARDPATTPDRLRELAGDEIRPVRYWAAVNVHTPRDALERLARDEDDHVRACAIHNLHFPEMVMRWQANGGQISPAERLSVFLHQVVHHPRVPGALRAEVRAAGHCPDSCPRWRYDSPDSNDTI
ncbi:hypothetical protein [Dactylosporangium sp. NPDC049140]|jgi:hypothetical protein|uniref:hypothetical protein n=1 Tax=Dactylosporangium sp. NPDC049140 TaxID=3155647 RepID=UPI00340F7030